VWQVVEIKKNQLLTNTDRAILGNAVTEDTIETIVEKDIKKWRRKQPLVVT
jgi:hypothetical protein